MDVAADPLSPITRRCLDRADRGHISTHLKPSRWQPEMKLALSGVGLKEPVRVAFAFAPPIGRA